jgi:LmbE family N-acetylglucosaminyl deacetylase
LDDAIVRPRARVPLTTADGRRDGDGGARERDSSAPVHAADMNPKLRPLDDVAALGRLLTVWAHPDDETYLAGGVMAMARDLGQPVTCVTATPGDHADTAEARVRAGRIRAEELANALRTLGVDDMVLLGISDGECDMFDDGLAVEMISAVIRDRRPDTIITFGPDGFTGHADHRTVSRWVTSAAAATRPRARVLFPAATADLVADGRDIDARFGVFDSGLPVVCSQSELALDVTVDGPWLETKLRALRAHSSQTTGLIRVLGEERYRRWVSSELFVEGSTPSSSISSQWATRPARARRSARSRH